MPSAMPLPKIPHIPRIFLVAILITVALASSLLLIAATNPRALTRMIGPDYVPVQDSSDRALSELDSGSRMELTFPFRTIYSPGDSFRVTVNLRNHFQEDAAFYLSVAQESGSEGVLPSYSEAMGTLAPGGIASSNIEIATLPSSPKGIYEYDVTACSGGPCSGGEPYSQGKIIFRLV